MARAANPNAGRAPANRRASAPPNSYTPPYRENIQNTQQQPNRGRAGMTQQPLTSQQLQQAGTRGAFGQQAYQRSNPTTLQDVGRGFNQIVNNMVTGYQAAAQRSQAANQNLYRNNLSAEAQRRYGVTMQTPGMGDVQRVSQINAPAPSFGLNYNQQRKYNPYVQWAPDNRAAQKYLGYGSPSYGLTTRNPAEDRMYGGAIGDGYEDYTPAMAYAKPPKAYTPPAQDYADYGYGRGYGWGGGGGGGGGGYTERAPEWYEKMLSWKF